MIFNYSSSVLSNYFSSYTSSPPNNPIIIIHTPPPLLHPPTLAKVSSSNTIMVHHNLFHNLKPNAYTTQSYTVASFPPFQPLGEAPIHLRCKPSKPISVGCRCNLRGKYFPDSFLVMLIPHLSICGLTAR